MSYRAQICAAALSLFCGISFLEAQPGAPSVTFSTTDNLILRQGHLVVKNDKKDERLPKAIHFTLVDEKDAKKSKKMQIELSELSQIHFGKDRKKNNPDLLIEADGDEHRCRIESSFVIHESGKGKAKHIISHTIKDPKLDILFLRAPKVSAETSASRKTDKDPHWIAPLGDGQSPDKIRYALHHPFWNEPMVRRLKSASDCCKLPELCSLQKCADDDKLYTYYKRFERSATFPQMRFGPDGECIETPGVIVYEGMQLLVVQDGRYELAFNASTPRSPVTMRLTVNVVFKECRAPLQLTIPAIALVPEYRSGDTYGMGSSASASNNYQENWNVRHVGYSQVLRDRLNDGDSIDFLGRDGVARFGTLPLSR